jgi:hypothetical protein
VPCLANSTGLLCPAYDNPWGRTCRAMALPSRACSAWPLGRRNTTRRAFATFQAGNAMSRCASRVMSGPPSGSGDVKAPHARNRATPHLTVSTVPVVVMGCGQRPALVEGHRVVMDGSRFAPAFADLASEHGWLRPPCRPRPASLVRLVCLVAARAATRQGVSCVRVLHESGWCRQCAGDRAPRVLLRVPDAEDRKDTLNP